MNYKRYLDEKLYRYSKFPVVGILGPRQSGKTTLAKKVYKNHVFINLEDPEIRFLAQEDPIISLQASLESSR